MRLAFMRVWYHATSRPETTVRLTTFWPTSEDLRQLWAAFFEEVDPGLVVRISERR